MHNFNKLLKNWSIAEILKNVKIQPGVYKIVTKNGSYILKRKKNKEIILLEYEMLNHLKTKDIPTSAPLKNINGMLWLEVDDKLYAVYPFIEGESLLYDYNKNNIEIIYKYGRNLGRLHIGLEDFTPSNQICHMDILKELFDWAIPTIEKNIDIDMLDKFKATIDIIKNDMVFTVNSLAKQPIHRDPHPQNMIFENGEWRGYIDFDLCRMGHKVFDLSYILTGLLIRDFEIKSTRDKWLNLIHPIISGYEETNSLSKEEKDSMWYIFLSIQLICIAYFFDINDINLAYKNLDSFYWIYNSNSIIQRKIK